MSTTEDFFIPPVIQDDPKRLAISVDGRDKRGKTHWCLMTAPEPIAVVSNDTGTHARVQDALRAGRKISGVFNVDFVTPDPRVIAAAKVDQAQHDEWKKAWAHYKEGIYRIMDDKKIRTLVKDTETGLYELAQLNTFGKMRSNARKDLWAELNADYCKVFWDLYKGRPDLNILLIHKAKKAYGTDDKPTGKFERAGHKDVGFQVDLSLNFDWDTTMRNFYTEIDAGQPLRYMKNRDNLIAKRWYADDEDNPSHFGYLAMTVFPETESEPEYWGL
jgi:hypothetical protein